MIAILLTLCLPFVKGDDLGYFDDHSNFMNRIYDGVTYYKNVGVLLKPAGQYIPYSGSIIVPFAHGIPHLRVIDHWDLCKDSDFSSMMYKLHVLASNKIKDKFSFMARTHGSKAKRFAALQIIAGGLLVSAAFNTYESFLLSSKVDLINENLGSVYDALKKIN